jgi:FAD/FMN-containing dehydrogenase
MTLSRRRLLSNGLLITTSVLLGGKEAFGSQSIAVKLSSKVDFGPLRKELSGTLWTPGDPGYKKLVFSTLWNQLRPENRLPDVVVKVADEQDVAKAVKFAKANNIKVVVRGGGHNYCCPSVRNGGMLIDLTDLTKVISVDAKNKTAVLQPIISNRDVQKLLNPQGLAFPTGHCPPVKISGYLLGGGMSWNQGVWGPGCNSVEALEIVTPDGELIKASNDENQDYFWAARGAGSGFFGVAVRYHLKLYDLPKAITGSAYFFPIDQADKVGQWLASIAPTLAPCIELSQLILQAPKDLADQCKDHNGKVCLVAATAFVDSPEEGAKVLKPFEDCPVKCLSKSVNTPFTFDQLFDASGNLWQPDLRNRVDAIYSNANPGDVFHAIWKDFVNTPSPLSLFFFAIFTGHNVPAALPDCAFSMSTKLYGGTSTLWKDANDDKENLDWHERFNAKLKPFIYGHYVGEADTMGHPDYYQKSYSGRNFERLAKLRKKYDPTGVFFAPGEGIS